MPDSKCSHGSSDLMFFLPFLYFQTAAVAHVVQPAPALSASAPTVASIVPREDNKKAAEYSNFS